MSNLIKEALIAVDKRFNPRVENESLLADVKGLGTVSYFQEKDNNVCITDNYNYFKPSELNDYFIKSELFYSKYKHLNISDLYNSIGKIVEFTYCDYDNGPIHGVGVIREIAETKDAHFSIKMDRISGNTLLEVYIYDENGSVLAGDDSDSVYFNIIENA